MAAAKPFWTSFFDGLTGEGIFGDLRLPGSPTRMFKPEPQADSITELLAEPSTIVSAEDDGDSASLSKHKS
jgi:hypothetical protein